MLTVTEALSARPYPGRGCLAARLDDDSLWLGYFLTGRSEASRSRVVERSEAGDLRVADSRGEGECDPLRHYVAAARRDPWTVVGNGDQVVPLAEALSASTDIVSTWTAHTYEPDPPIYTPRVWICAGAEEQVLVGSSRRSARMDGTADRGLWMPERLGPGHGVLITTYAGTGDSVVTSGLPLNVSTASPSGKHLLDSMWEALGSSLRVAAFVVQPADLSGALHRSSVPLST